MTGWDCGCPNPIIPQPEPATGNWQLAATGNWKLAAIGWQRATGAWELETGNWQLATGNWLLETGNRQREPAPHDATSCSSRKCSRDSRMPLSAHNSSIAFSRSGLISRALTTTASTARSLASPAKVSYPPSTG